MSNMRKKLDGKVAVVTGASKGIGARIAKHLADEGVAVVVNYSGGREMAESVVARIEKAGDKVTAIRADVSKADDVERLFTEAKRAYGRLEVLVNNAGAAEFGAAGDHRRRPLGHRSGSPGVRRIVPGATRRWDGRPRLSASRALSVAS